MMACVLTAVAPVVAGPPLARLSPAGHTYKLEAAAVGVDQRTWLAGSAAVTGESDDAFLTLLDPAGDTLWEKRFGSPEAGETVRAVLTLSAGGALLSGHVNSDLEQAWQGAGATDWARQTFLARVDQKGDLLRWIDLRAEPSPEAANEAHEPWLTVRCLARAESGDYLAGGSFTGKYGDLISRQGGRQSTALLLRLSPQLEVLDAIPLKGDSLDALSVTGDRVLGAGVGDSQQGDPMAPSTRRPIAWDLTTPLAPRELWRGELKSNTQCLQLDGTRLLFSDNDSSGPQSVSLASGQIETLPEGVLGTAECGDQLYATGYRCGQTGDRLSESGSAILWRRADEWVPALRWGTTRRDFVPYIFSADGQLTMIGYTEGDLPRLPPGGGAERWMWVRLDTPPTPELASAVGARPPGTTRAELADELASLSFLERAGFDHFAGFTTIQGRPAAVVTEEGPGVDGWSLWRNAEGTGEQHPAPEKLASWAPETPPFSLMEPQIFPHVSGDTVMCRDFLWPDQDRGVMLARWARLDARGEIAAARTLPSDTAVDCQVLLAGQEVRGVEAGPDFWLGVEWNAEAQRRMLVACMTRAGELAWKQPYGEWTEFTDLEWLGAARLSQAEFVALGKADDQVFLQAFGSGGRPTWKVPLGARQGHAVGVAGGRVYLATSSDEQRHDLTLHSFSLDGQLLTTRELPVSAPVIVSRILSGDGTVVLVGGQAIGSEWRGFIADLGSDGQGWRTRQLKVGATHGLDDALWLDGALWVGGEVTRDHETDVFWGRLK